MSVDLSLSSLGGQKQKKKKQQRMPTCRRLLWVHRKKI
jgi:hypothetical protein